MPATKATLAIYKKNLQAAPPTSHLHDIVRHKATGTGLLTTIVF